MYKCIECGHIFDAGEEAIKKEYHTELGEGFYEKFAYCPICGGDFEETKRCEICGGEFLEDELIDGHYCPDCLHDAINYCNFLDFATYEDTDFTKAGMLEDFMMREIFEIDGDFVLNKSSATFKTFLKNTYMEIVRDDRIFHEGALLEKIQNYLTDLMIWDDFAYYLYHT